MANVSTALVSDIKQILDSAKTKAFTLVNSAMVLAYWQIGQRIAQEEQKGAARADYGLQLLKGLAQELARDLGKGLDERELRKMRQFYRVFPIRDTLRPELAWSHYRTLLRVENDAGRSFYLSAAADEGWTVRQLDRNIQSFYYERIVANQRKAPLPAPDDKTVTPPAKQFVKDPFLFEFLGLDTPASFTENDLESAILGKLQHFLMELGSGFAFVARQLCMKTETQRFFIDLVFYNYILKCFVIVDLKIGALTHQDIGQVDMYLRMFDALKRIAGDNPTIGIILCTEKDETLVKYSVLSENEQLFASRYRLVLPSEQQLMDQIKSVTA